MRTETRSPVDSGIRLVVEDRCRVLEMWGEIDAALRERASESIARIFAAGGPVVIDTSRVTFMDSSGLAFLIQLCMIVDEEGMTVTLRNPTQAVLDLLEMVGMGGRLAVENDDDAAGFLSAPLSERAWMEATGGQPEA